MKKRNSNIEEKKLNIEKKSLLLDIKKRTIKAPNMDHDPLRHLPSPPRFLYHPNGMFLDSVSSIHSSILEQLKEGRMDERKDRWKWKNGKINGKMNE